MADYPLRQPPADDPMPAATSPLEGGLHRNEIPAPARSEPEAGEVVPDDGRLEVVEETRRALDSWAAGYLDAQETGNGTAAPDYYGLEESARVALRESFWQSVGSAEASGDTARVAELYSMLGLAPERLAVLRQARELAIAAARAERERRGFGFLTDIDTVHSGKTEWVIANQGPPEGVTPQEYADFLRLQAGDVSAMLARPAPEHVAVHLDLRYGRTSRVREIQNSAGESLVRFRVAADFEEIVIPYVGDARDAVSLARQVRKGAPPKYVSHHVGRACPAPIAAEKCPWPSKAGGWNASPRKVAGDRAREWPDLQVDVPDRPEPRPDAETIVDATDLADNFAELGRHYGPATSVVDCRLNAYNHGMGAVHAFVAAGADVARVSTIGNALSCQAQDTGLMRLWVDDVPPGADLKAAINAGVELSVSTIDELRNVLAAADQLLLAAGDPLLPRAKVWVEVDMGQSPGTDGVSKEFQDMVDFLRANHADLECMGTFNRLHGPDHQSHALHGVYAERMERAHAYAATIPGSQPVCLFGEALTQRPETGLPLAIDYGAAVYGLVPRDSELASLRLVPGMTGRLKVNSRFKIEAEEIVSYEGSPQAGPLEVVELMGGYSAFAPWAHYPGDPLVPLSLPPAAGENQAPYLSVAVGQPAMNAAFAAAEFGSQTSAMATLFGRCESTTAPSGPGDDPIYLSPTAFGCDDIREVPLGVHGAEVTHLVKRGRDGRLELNRPIGGLSSEARIVVDYQLFTAKVRDFREQLGEDTILTVELPSTPEPPPAELIAVHDGGGDPNISFEKLHSTKEPATAEEATTVNAAVKANGYNHGLVEAGVAAVAGGADKLAVGSVREAILLRDELRRLGTRRKDGSEVPIVCWLNAPDADFDAAIKEHIEIGVKTYAELLGVIRASRRVQAEAVQAGEAAAPALVSLRCWTGLNQGEARGAELRRMIRLATFAIAENEVVAGTVYQHFRSSAANPNLSVDLQADEFAGVLAQCRKEGLYSTKSPSGDTPAITAQAAASVVAERFRYDEVAPGFRFYYGPDALRVEVPVRRSRFVPAGHYLEGAGVIPAGTNVSWVRVGKGQGIPGKLAGALVRFGEVTGRVLAVNMEEMLIDTGLQVIEPGTICTVLGSPESGSYVLSSQAEYCETDPGRLTTAVTRLPIVAASDLQPLAA